MRVRLFLCCEEEEDDHRARASVDTSKQKGKFEAPTLVHYRGKHLPVLKSLRCQFDRPCDLEQPVRTPKRKTEK
jgi:hypothetical protein